MYILYARYAIALNLPGFVQQSPLHAYEGLVWMQLLVNAYSVHIGGYALALSICLPLFSSLGCAYTRGRLVDQSRLLAHRIDNTKIGQEK